MVQKWFWVLTLLLGVAGGGLLAGTWRSPVATHLPAAPPQESNESRSPTGRIATEISRLRRDVEAESAARRALELEVEALRDRLAKAEGLQLAPHVERFEQQAMQHAGTLRRFDAAKLLEQDLSASVVADVKHRYEQNRLEILHLRDRAIREAWVDSARFDEEVRKLERGLRHQLGPDDYDVLLYATGEPNRVVLQQVLAGSSAEDAGLEPEDVVVRYGTREIFHPSDLVEATTAGQIGESVELTVIRGAERHHFRIRRGPLGATVRSMSRAPGSW